MNGVLHLFHRNAVSNNTKATLQQLKTNKQEQEKPLKLLTQTTQFLRDKRILPRSLSFINYSAHNPSEPLDSIPCSLTHVVCLRAEQYAEGSHQQEINVLQMPGWQTRHF